MTKRNDDIEAILRRQDEALALLELLRLAERPAVGADAPKGGGRRDFRRWPLPEGVKLELHDGERWHATDCSDVGIGGARLNGLPPWFQGPGPARLSVGGSTAALVLADIMWRDAKTGVAGLRFDFVDNEDRDQWTGRLIDALLARYSLS